VHTQLLCQKGAKTLIHAVFPLYVLDENATVGERIRFYRRKRDMSCNTLSDKCDLSRHEIMRYESGEIEPGLGNLMKIASILKIQPDKLFDDYYR
jgi:transcriptional regulator with XRE-family HTH domain